LRCGITGRPKLQKIRHAAVPYGRMEIRYSIYVSIVLIGICLSGCLNQSEEDSSAATGQGQAVESAQPPTGSVLINTSSSFLSTITVRDLTGTYAIDAPYGKQRTFMILQLDFVNRGCPEFEINPSHYAVVVGGVQYDPLVEVDRPWYVPMTGVDKRSTINLTQVVTPAGVTILDRMTLRDGGAASGSLVYDVPSAAESGYTVEFVGPVGCEVIINSE